MLIGTLNSYHFTSLAVYVTVLEGYKVSQKQILMGSFSQTHLNSWNEIWLVESVQIWAFRYHLQKRNFVAKENNCRFIDS